MTNSKFIEEYINGKGMKKELCQTGLEKEIWNIAHKNDQIENQFNLKEEYEKVFDRVCKSFGRNRIFNGKSDTVFGEIIRGLTKLLYRNYNDGDDICCGPYSGIWYGLRYKLYCPFTYSDNAVEYWDSDFDRLNELSCFYNNYADNIMLNALILETFDDFDKDNFVDIANYYDNIVKFILDDDIIKKFADNDIDITNNFGCYAGLNKCYSNIEINTINEDIYIKFTPNDIVFDCNFFSPSFKFNLKFAKDDIDKELKENKEIFKYMIDISSRKIGRDEWIKEKENFVKKIEEFGYVIKDRNIVRKSI